MREVSQKGIYSRAEIYDLLFGWNRSAEFLFVDAVFQSHGLCVGDRLLEVACGTGVCSLHLEALGWTMEGLDLSSAMVEAFNSRAREQGRAMVAHRGDMCDFSLETTFAGAYCPLGSIGLLNEDDRMLSHLEAMARAIRPGGLYLIDLGLNPTGTAPLDLKEVDWYMEGENWNVHAVDEKVRVEDLDGELIEELEWEGVPLEYEADHFLGLVRDSGLWEHLTSFPEIDTTEEGIAIFDPAVEDLEGDEERAMILLKRKESSHEA